MDARNNAGIKFAERKEPKLIQELIDKNFIEVIKQEKSQYKVLIAPRYNPTEGKFVRSEQRRRAVWQLKKSRNGYIIVPNEVVDNGHLAELSGRQTAVLLKLYEHNFLHYWGGVDPNVIHVSSDRFRVDYLGLVAFIDEHLYQDIGLSRKQFIVTLRRLLRTGLVRVARILCDVDSTGDMNYICDYTNQEIQSGYQVVWALRPTYQFSKHVEVWIERNESYQDQ